MKTVEIDAAQTDLASLVERAAAGEEIILAKSGKPVARLTRLEDREYVRKPGGLKGRIHLKENFDDPLPPDIARAFGIEE